MRTECCSLVELMHFPGDSVARTKTFYRFLRSDRICGSEQFDSEPVRLPLEFAGMKKGVLLQEKPA